MFAPDYRHMEDVLRNRRPRRLPLYEHVVDVKSMERVLGTRFAELSGGDEADRRAYFDHYCRFFRELTYDTVSFECGACFALPDRGAIMGGRPGPIQSRADFDAYPWRELPRLYWAEARPRFDALRAAMPPGMKAIGGIGNGPFELAEDLVGLEYLPLLEADDPELFAELFVRIGEYLGSLWTSLLAGYADLFAGCRIGDDLGFKNSLLTNPRTVRQHLIPIYRRVIALVHESGRPFLMHSCGCIFEIMPDLIAAGIDAKHSNEDAIAPFDRWIEDYGGRLGLCGGFDMDFLCQRTPAEIHAQVLARGRRFRAQARGYALGSGNSIPDYIPLENYLAMIAAAQDLRREEGTP
jgi:hypothetical protein